MVNESTLDLGRPRLPTNASLSDSEIQGEETPTDGVTIKMESEFCSRHSVALPCQVSDAHMIPVSHVIPCVVCSEDSILRCKRCKRCYYCSTACRDIHYPYHSRVCEESLEDVQDESRAILENPDVLPSYVRTELIREGIINSGNTCFLAASLQCLYSVTPLRRLLISDNYKRYLAPEASLKIEND